MTVWILASLPFWVTGFFFFPCAAVVCVLTRKPGETDADLGGQFIAALITGGILLFIAAWMCS